MPPPLSISSRTARRFLLRTLGLAEPLPGVAAALDRFGYIQVDPINVCGRMHDLILRNRVRDYREGALHDYIHSTARPGFEHYLPHLGVLVAYPADAWPFLAGLIRNRRLRRGVYRRRLGPKMERIANHILNEIAERGPLTSDQIEHEGRSTTPWGTSGRLVKNLLEVLFVHGRVLITQRRGFRRVYDLTERVLPRALLETPPMEGEAVARWAVLLRLRQRRLVTLKRDDLRRVADAVQPVKVEGCPMLYCLREDLRVLEEEIRVEGDGTRVRTDGRDARPYLMDTVRLLAPLDPLIYDRRVTAALWDFKYTWEAYTPAHKRQRGHYAMPVLAGTEIVGHVDPKADRAKGKLAVVSRQVRRGYVTAPAVRELAAFLGLR